jgi:resuscitation-promoting factor RpfB
MKSTSYLLRKSSFWIGLTLVSLFATCFVVFSRPTRADNQRIVTVYHDGIEQTMVTSATDVKDALKRINVNLNKYDAVEPAKDTEFTEPSYTVNVYRARPVTVVDGEQRYTVMSPHTSARKIAEAAGLITYAEDEFTLTRIDDFLGEDGVGLKLVIKRATPLTLVLYGKISQIRTQATTVEGLLKERKVTLGTDDGTNLPSATPITAGMTLEVWRNGEQTITEEQDIAFPVETIRDADKPTSYRQVQTPGKPGKKIVTYQLEMRDGKEVSRKELQSVVTAQPEKQVETIGWKQPMGNITAEKSSYLAAAGIPQSDWGYIDYVIQHESRWNVASRNSGGCLGLGQSCPGSKLINACPNWDTDPVCQLRFFSSYANGRYGSWAAAYNAKVAKGWW